MSKDSVTQKQSQRKKILQYIAENGSTTVREMFIYLNINSPTKRISELRDMGLIKTVKCSKVDANGKTVRYCRYYLKEEQ